MKVCTLPLSDEANGVPVERDLFEWLIYLLFLLLFIVERYGTISFDRTDMM